MKYFPYAIKVLGLRVDEIARLKSWFENRSAEKNITDFWEEAFNAGVKTALHIMGSPVQQAAQPATMDTVSLEKCALRVHAVTGKQIAMNGAGGCKNIAKAVLDAAGVKYVD